MRLRERQQEADLSRLVHEIEMAAPQVGLKSRVMGRLGDLLVASGRKLQMQYR
jgi:hypothetical protein